MSILQQDNQPVTANSVIFMDSVQPQEVKWLWYPYIPLGKITILMGDPGEGKSTLALNIAAAVSRGLDFPDLHTVRTPPQFVCYQNAEDGLADTIRPRLDKAGADASMILCLNEGAQDVSIVSAGLQEVIAKLQPKLVILDPLQAYLGADVDMHRANEIRPVMHYLSNLAEQHGCAILLIGHMNKRSDMKSSYRALGSIDLTAAARSVLIVARDPQAPEHRVIAQVKNSLAPEGELVSFTMDEEGQFRFEGPYAITVDKLLQGSENTRPRNRACELLQEWLTQHGRLSVEEIMELADSEGISKRTLKRAKSQLPIRSVRSGEKWYWELCSPTT